MLDRARGSALTFRGLTGEDCYHLYLCACGTGFRSGELAALVPESFDFAGVPATVTLPTAVAKNRRQTTQPLPPAVADALRGFVAPRPPGQPVWPGTWHERGADMLRIDLEAAGVPYEVPGPDGPLYADFHALRHGYVSMLARSSLTVKQAQKLARHSTPELTIGRYAHAELAELGEAVGKLPALAGPAGGDSSAGAVEMVPLSAAELQALNALPALGLILAGLHGCTLVVPDLATAGDAPERAGTEGSQPHRRAG